jgi:dolichol-phosphate mannosyltransferase
MVAWTGFKQMPIEYRRAGRLAGRGASYPELFRLAFEALAAFSDVPLALAAYLGLFTAATSALAAIVLVGLWLAQAIEPTPMVWGVAALLFLGGVQLIGLGIIGRYLARVHEEALRRPLYVLDSVRSSRER